MFEQQFKNIDDALREDSGCSTELDYIEQTSWILFLKYLSDYETEAAQAAMLDGKEYTPLFKKKFTWGIWAAPKNKDGQIDKDAPTGDDLRDFVNKELFPYLKNFRQEAQSVNTLEYKIGEIFSEVNNKLQSGYTLREIINKIDEMRFGTVEERHEMSALYEDKIKNMGNAGRNGGEYYTPRPLIQAIIKIVNPKIGETIYDGACGSAGFLCEAYAYLREDKKGKLKELTSSELKTLRSKTFYGKEKKSLPYVIGIMNMILHGIEAPNIEHTNTLAESLDDIQNKDRVDVILANPPFGGNERGEIKQNFPIQTGETAYLFLQHFVKKLKKGGRAGIVIKNTFLSNTDNASIALRKQLLEDCELYAVLDFPNTPFTGTGAKTVVLFFEKGRKSEKIWYYQLDPSLKFGKTSPLTQGHLDDFVKLEKTKADSENSWTVAVADIDEKTWDLSVKNPNRPDETDTRTPEEILAEMETLEDEINTAMQGIKSFLEG